MARDLGSAVCSEALETFLLHSLTIVMWCPYFVARPKAYTCRAYGQGTLVLVLPIGCHQGQEESPSLPDQPDYPNLNLFFKGLVSWFSRQWCPEIKLWNPCKGEEETPLHEAVL